MNRRAFIKGAGAFTVIAAGGGVWRANDQGAFNVGEGPAYKPWTNWQDEMDEGPLSLVRAGILVSNPHNTQPWLFRVSEDRIELFADTSRSLGSFDPYLREMHLGLGCALENMILAASANDYKTNITIEEGTLDHFSGSTGKRLVASIDLIPGEEETDDLYEAIPNRHTNRGGYDIERPLPPQILSIMSAMAGEESDTKIFFYTNERERTDFADLVIEATEAIIADDEMVHDSDVWYRHKWSDVQHYRDGVTLDTAGLPRLTTTIARMLPQPSAEKNHEYWLDSTRNMHVATAPVFGIIAVRNLYDLKNTLIAGRLWQRLHLWATTQGIAMQPLNQPVEIVDRERELGNDLYWKRKMESLIGDQNWYPTFAFRAGYPLREALASPRRPVGDVVI